MSNPFEQFQLSPREEKKAYDRNPNPNPFDKMKMEESWGKSVLRSLLQVPAGAAQAFTFPMDLISLIGTGESFDPEEIEHLKQISAREGIPFDEEKYMQAIKGASEAFPTQGNIEKLIEDKTGLPLEPKTDIQKGIRLGATAGKINPGSALQKGAAAATAPAVSYGLKEAGAPEPIADIAGLVASGQIAGKVPSAGLKPKQKPSGMIERRFEGIEKPTKVSPSRYGKINEAIEKDFRGISDKLIEESPVGKTFNALKDDSGFKSKVGDLFQDVEALSEQIPNKFSTKLIKNQIIKKQKSIQTPGFTESEFNQTYKKNMNKFLRDTPTKDITAKDLVSQYRANNRALGELYEPGKSSGFNRAKKEALIDYNKIIADTIETGFPDSEFSKLFKFTNKRWSEIKDSETISSFIDDMFKGKVRYDKSENFFKKHNLEGSFKRALGEEIFPKFKTLMNDLMSTKEAHSLLKQAKEKGFSKLSSTGLAYLVSPKLMAGKLTLDASKKVWKSLLDKPKLVFTWGDGVKAMKNKNFAEAQLKFDLLDQDLNQATQTQDQK